MFKRPMLSNLVYTKSQIIIHAFTLSTIHPGKFIPLNLENIDYKKNLSLKYANNTVGRFQREIIHKDQKSVFLYYENLAPNFNFDNFWASMHIKAKLIQCPICKSFFNKNESPCGCITGAPFINLNDFTLEDVQLHNYKIDNIDSYDCRDSLCSEFFDRSLHKLTFMEPI